MTLVHSSTNSYDSEANLIREGTPQGQRQYAYDAAGRQVSLTEPPRRGGQPTLTLTQGYDGDGQRIRRTQFGAPSYELRSSVLGGSVITDLDAQGQKVITYVYANGQLLAEQSYGGYVTWIHPAPDGSGGWKSLGGGSTLASTRVVSLDPMGDDVGVANPYLEEPDTSLGSYPRFGDPTDLRGGCALDGQSIPCEIVGKVISRNSHAFIYNIISRRIGQRQPLYGTNQNYSGAATASGAFANQNTETGYWTAGLTITAPPPTLDVTAVGYSMLWLNFLPQNPQQQLPGPKPAPAPTPPPAPGLPTCIKDYLAKFFDRSMLDAITWEQGIPWYVPGGNDNGAFTLDDHIYFGTDAFNPADGIQLREITLIGHETAHVGQYRHNGSLRMKAKYLANSAIMGAAGSYVGVPFDIASYYGNRFEREAFNIEKKIRDDLAKNGNPCP